MTLHVESAGDGPPLVLLHGFAMHGGLFAPIVHAFTRRHRVHVVDLPGHGFSGEVQATSLESVADAVVCALGLREPAAILGWSFGGLVAQHIAHARPDAVAALLLACTSPRFVASPDWPHAMSVDTLARFGDELRVSYRLTLQRFLTLQVQGSDAGRATLASLRQALFARSAPSRATLSAALRILIDADLRERRAGHRGTDARHRRRTRCVDAGRRGRVARWRHSRRPFRADRRGRACAFPLAPRRIPGRRRRLPR